MTGDIFDSNNVDTADPLSDGSDAGGHTDAPETENRQPAPPESIRSREKTFTDELRELVEKVTGHEAGPDMDDIDLETLSDDDLVRLFHVLFYRAANLAGLSEINPDADVNTTPSEWDDETVITQIHHEMERLGLQSYALMPYSLEKKCFLLVINHIHEIDIYNFVITANDTLYAAIKAGADGVILTPAMLQADSAMRKRFSSFAGQSADSLYLNSLKNIYIRVIGNIPARCPVPEESETDLSPLLVIRLKERGEALSPAGITLSMMETLALPFYIYSRLRRLDIEKVKTDGAAHAHESLEYFYNQNMRSDSGRCCVISCRYAQTRESGFLFSYFIAALASKLSPSAVIFRIEKNRVVVFTDAAEAGKLRSLGDDYNRACGAVLALSEYDNSKKTGFHEFIKSALF